MSTHLNMLKVHLSVILSNGDQKERSQVRNLSDLRAILSSQTFKRKMDSLSSQFASPNTLKIWWRYHPGPAVSNAVVSGEKHLIRAFSLLSIKEAGSITEGS